MKQKGEEEKKYGKKIIKTLSYCSAVWFPIPSIREVVLQVREPDTQ